ncbi:MAG: F0F1 ATP synthase subunit epsilon [Armatimonas sp.]
MASTFLLDIVTPEKTVLSEPAVSLTLPGAAGSFGVLAGHAPLLADLGVGECMVKLASGQQHTLVLSGGFADVTREKVTVLADTAEMDNEIDVSRAEVALSRAQEMLASVEGNDRQEANLAVARAQARLRVARGGSNR